MILIFSDTFNIFLNKKIYLFDFRELKFDIKNDFRYITLVDNSIFSIYQQEGRK